MSSVTIYDSVHEAAWFYRKHRRMHPCDEWNSYKDYIIEYDGPLEMSDTSGWSFYDVFAGKHTDRTKYVLTKEVTEKEWYEHMCKYENTFGWSESCNYVRFKNINYKATDTFSIVLIVPLRSITGYSSEDRNNEFKQYIKNFSHSNECRELVRDISKYEGGSPVAEVTFNEWKDADQGVITISSGRTQLQFTLMEAAQLLNAIPEAMRGYRDARVNAVQDQIKALNEALAVLQQVPTQTNASQ